MYGRFGVCMVRILKLFGAVLLMTGGFFLTYMSVNHLQSFYINTTNILVRFGIVLIFIFTILIVLRYVLLMLFSILQTIRNTSAKTNNPYRFETVSVIVPCYNEEDVIIASLKSLISQTYPYLEIIVIDDGSQDRTYTLAQQFSFEEEYRSLKVLTKQNGGKSKALNYAIEKAKGTLICSVDADSKLDPNAIELLVQHFQDPQIAAVAGSVHVINTDSFLTKLYSVVP